MPVAGENRNRVRVLISEVVSRIARISGEKCGLKEIRAVGRIAARLGGNADYRTFPLRDGAIFTPGGRGPE